MMAMVDSMYQFVWGSCGLLGNPHDVITELWQDITENYLIPNTG